MKADWYDYDKGVLLQDKFPSGKCQLLYEDSFVVVEILYSNKDCVLFKCIDNRGLDHNDLELVVYERSFKDFRPLDWDKYTVKAVPMEWGVKAGIDFEFSDDGSYWVVNTLKSTEGDSLYSSPKYTWKHCRPRMNHPQFMTVAQFDLIPKHVFNLSWFRHKDPVFGSYYIVEFTGLKDGYKFAHEVEW